MKRREVAHREEQSSLQVALSEAKKQLEDAAHSSNHTEQELRDELKGALSEIKASEEQIKTLEELNSEMQRTKDEKIKILQEGVDKTLVSKTAQRRSRRFTSSTGSEWGT